MKRLIAMAAMVMLMVGPGCGGDTHEKLADESVQIMRDMAAAIDTITNEATAKAAKPKLEAIAARMKALNERMKKLPDPTEAQVKAMTAKHEKEMEQIEERMGAKMMTIGMDPAIQQVLGEIDLKMN